MEFFTATGKLEKFFFWATRDTIFKFLPHTRVNMGASIFFTAALISAFRSARSRGNGGTNILSLTRTKCALHSNHRFTRVIFQHTKRLLHTGAAIFSLHTLASPSGLNVNYD